MAKSSRNNSNNRGKIKQKSSRRAFKQNVQNKMKQGKSKEQAVRESQKIQQRNK